MLDLLAATDQLQERPIVHEKRPIRRELITVLGQFIHGSIRSKAERVHSAVFAPVVDADEAIKELNVSGEYFRSVLHFRRDHVLVQIGLGIAAVCAGSWGAGHERVKGWTLACV